MKNKKINGNNNRGASLIVVIVCMLFAGIIASIVLGISTSNVKFSALQNVISQTGYSAEQALDVTKAKIQEYADKAYDEAMIDYITTYINEVEIGGKDPENYFNHLFQKRFIKQLYDHAVITSGTANSTISQVCDSKVSVSVDLGNITNLCNLTGTSWNKDSILLEVDDTESRLFMKNVAILYTSGADNSVAATDISLKVDLPTILPCDVAAHETNVTIKYKSTEEKVGKLVENLKEFAIVTDGTVSGSGSVSSTDTGNVGDYINLALMSGTKEDFIKTMEKAGNCDFKPINIVAENGAKKDGIKIDSVDGGEFYHLISEKSVTTAKEGKQKDLVVIAAENAIVTAGNSNPDFEGIIIAKGNVTIECQFHGIVVAGGTVTIKDFVDGEYCANGKGKQIKNQDIHAAIISKGNVIINSTGGSGNIHINNIDDSLCQDYVEEIYKNKLLQEIFSTSITTISEPEIITGPEPSPSAVPTGEVKSLLTNYERMNIEFENRRDY